jgi:hypothetical protein
MRYTILLLSIVFVGCHISTFYGKSGMFSPDRGLDNTVIGIRAGKIVYFKPADIVVNVEYSEYGNGSGAIILSGGLRKTIDPFYFEVGLGMGYLDRDTVAICAGPHGNIYFTLGWKGEGWDTALGVIHRSNPTKHADNGDIGANFLVFNINITWSKIKKLINL